MLRDSETAKIGSVLEEDTTMEISIAFLKPGDSSETPQLYYAEAMPTSRSNGTVTHWMPQTDASTNLSKRWKLWFWKRIVTVEGLKALFGEIIDAKELATKSMRLPLDLSERPLVFVTPEDSKTPLCPTADQSAWLWELWDDRKSMLDYLSSNEIERANGAILKYFGLDLNFWRDRVGNITAFFPTGVRAKWHYDGVTRSVVIYTNLRNHELEDHRASLQLWDGEQTSYHQILPVAQPNFIFEGIDIFRTMQLTIFRRNEVVYQTGRVSVLQRIGIEGRLPGITREGVEYYYGDAGIKTAVGEIQEPAWVRHPRERQAFHEKNQLVKNLAFKFYEPDGQGDNGDVRRQALDDIATLLNRAQQNIRIWDPYFASDYKEQRSDTLANLALIKQVKNLSVPIEILLSCKDWTKSCGSKTLEMLELELISCRRTFPERYENVFCRAWVRQEETAFHDRFLIIDNRDVWMLGSSLNGLGLKHTTLIQIKYADQVVTAFDKIWRSTRAKANPNQLRWGRVLKVLDAS